MCWHLAFISPHDRKIVTKAPDTMSLQNYLKQKRTRIKQFLQVVFFFFDCCFYLFIQEGKPSRRYQATSHLPELEKIPMKANWVVLTSWDQSLFIHENWVIGPTLPEIKQSHPSTWKKLEFSRLHWVYPEQFADSICHGNPSDSYGSGPLLKFQQKGFFSVSILLRFLCSNLNKM